MGIKERNEERKKFYRRPSHSYKDWDWKGFDIEMFHAPEAYADVDTLLGAIEEIYKIVGNIHDGDNGYTAVYDAFNDIRYIIEEADL